MPPWQGQLARLEMAHAGREGLALALGVTERTLRRWHEGGSEPRPDVRLRIAELYQHLRAETTVGAEALITAHQAVEAVLAAPNIEEARLRARYAKAVLHKMLTRVRAHTL